MKERTWLDHTVYKIFPNEKTENWEVAILCPTSQTPTVSPGDDIPPSIMKLIHETYGESAQQLSEAKFQQEVERRITHSEAMLALLENNWTGQDLREWHVYGSILRPMAGIRIEGTFFLNGNGARYNQYTIHDYVVAHSPLDMRTREQYTLVTISHP